MSPSSDESRRARKHARRVERRGRRDLRDARREETRQERRLRRAERRVEKDPDEYEDLWQAEDALGDLGGEAQARRIARRKARLVRETIQFALVVGALAIFLRPVAWIVGIVWGFALLSQLARHVIEPELRQRWVDREVSRQLRREVPAQRAQVTEDQSRRLEELAAGVAHEIRNPITAARSLVQQMGEDPSSGQNVEYAEIALDELARVERSISHLLRFAREPDVSFGDMRMSEVVSAAVETFRDRIDAAGADVEIVADVDGRMRGDADKLRRVILNLLANALEALEEAQVPQPRIEIEAGENLAGTEVWVRVRDNGPGIDPERLQRIFSPFYTSKEAGTGLGLAVSKKVVDAHGGSIEAHSEPGSGTAFVLTLPKQRETPSEQGDPAK